MSNLVVRVLFALTAIPVALFLIYWGHWTRLGLVITLLSIGGWEWARMVAAKYQGPSAVLFLAPFSAGLLALGWALQGVYPGWVPVFATVVFLLYVLMGFAWVSMENLFPWIGLHLSGPLYVGLWGGMALELMGEGRGFASSAPFIVTMVAMWVSDTFAYFTGRLLGKHPMSPLISPKKTWEGAVGGGLFTVAFVVWLGPWAFHTPWQINVVLGILLSVVGQLGDLLESVLKRWSGFKDSSQVFPGHGGVLDRLDSLILAGPLVAVCMHWLGK